MREFIDLLALQPQVDAILQDDLFDVGYRLDALWQLGQVLGELQRRLLAR